MFISPLGVVGAIVGWYLVSATIPAAIIGYIVGAILSNWLAKLATS